MGWNNFQEFIFNNTITEDNRDFVKKELSLLRSEEWWRGYEACLEHRKKHEFLKNMRIEKSVKRFLDYLSDKTHNPNKA